MQYQRTSFSCNNRVVAHRCEAPNSVGGVTRRRHLLAWGANPNKVHIATRSSKGYGRVSQNEIVRNALNNRWWETQGVPDMRAIWIELYYAEQA